MTKKRTVSKMAEKNRSCQRLGFLIAEASVARPRIIKAAITTIATRRCPSLSHKTRWDASFLTYKYIRSNSAPTGACVSLSINMVSIFTHL